MFIVGHKNEARYRNNVENSKKNRLSNLSNTFRCGGYCVNHHMRKGFQTKFLLSPSVSELRGRVAARRARAQTAKQLGKG